MNLNRLLQISGGALALSLAFSAQAQTVLVNHNLVGDMDRTNQNLPNEAAWYKGGGSNVTLTPSTTGLQFTRSDAGTSRLLAANFVNNTAGYTLAIGETLRMSYSFNASAVPTGNAFNTDNRMSVLSFASDPSQRLSGDVSSANGPTVTNLSGYMFTFHISDELATTPLQLYKITGTSTFGSIGSFTSISGQTTAVEATGGLTAGVNYTLRLDVARVGLDEVNLTISYLDSNENVIASVTATDSSAAAITYDGFVYRASTHANFGGTQTITDFSVEVIPEPSTYAALFGLLALGFVAWRRRRK